MSNLSDNNRRGRTNSRISSSYQLFPCRDGFYETAAYVFIPGNPIGCYYHPRKIDVASNKPAGRGGAHVEALRRAYLPSSWPLLPRSIAFLARSRCRTLREIPKRCCMPRGSKMPLKWPCRKLGLVAFGGKEIHVSPPGMGNANGRQHAPFRFGEGGEEGD
jgi:hypothetical protein